MLSSHLKQAYCGLVYTELFLRLHVLKKFKLLFFIIW